MVHGKTAINTRSFDPRRHDTTCPGKQFDSLRPVQRHPLYDRLAAKGAVFGEITGWERPRSFGDKGEVEQIGWARQPWHDNAQREAKAARTAAGVIDLCAFAPFEILGKDAGWLLDRLSANRIPRKNGRISLNHLLTE